MIKTNYRHTLKACYLAYITQAIVNNLAPLLFLTFKNQFGIPLRKITLLITVNFCIQLAVDLFSAKFVDKIGYRFCIVTAHIFSAIGIAGIAVFPFIFQNAFAGLLTAVIIYATGGGLIEVLISPIVEACPTDNKASVMSMLHSFYCWGTVAVIFISTIFMYFLGTDSWRMLACFWAILPLLNSLYFSRVPIEKLTEDGSGMSIRQLLSIKTFWLFIILMLVAGASEQAMSQWASTFAESGLGVSKAIGDLAGPCLFSVLMGSARVFYAKYSEKVNLINFIAGSGVLCILAYLLTSFSPYPALSLLGCSLCGLSVGILWPGIFSIASCKFPKGGTALFAFLALAGDLGCSSGPTLVGMISGLFNDNLKAGLKAALIFPTILVIFILIYKKSKSTKSSK